MPIGRASGGSTRQLQSTLKGVQSEPSPGVRYIVSDLSFDPEQQSWPANDGRDFRGLLPLQATSNHGGALQYDPEVVGILVSGGLDSAILLKHLLNRRRWVKPFYIRSGMCWQ